MINYNNNNYINNTDNDETYLYMMGFLEELHAF